MAIIDIMRAEMEGTPRAAALKVAAVMLYPGNEIARENCLISVIFQDGSDFAEKHGLSMTIDPGAAGLIRRKVDPMSLVDEALSPVVQGSSKAPNAPRLCAGEVAGHILLSAIYADMRGEKDNSLRGLDH